MIFNYYGDGKGKTTASLGLLIRYFSIDKRVCIIHFDKYGSTINEHKVLEKLSIPHFAFGANRMCDNGMFRFGYDENDISEIKNGIEKLLYIYDDYDLIVLDELNIIWQAIKTLDYHYMELMKLFEYYKKNHKKDVVITGMVKNEDLLEISDLISEVKKIKHYFDDGYKAREGIEY